MSHPKYDASLFDHLSHLDTLFHCCSHRLLAEDMVSLLSKRGGNLEVHLILDSD
jgi:hypothetical protein